MTILFAAFLLGLVFNTTPGAVARTSTFALNNATIGHAVAIANKGWKQALVTSGFRSKSA